MNVRSNEQAPQVRTSEILAASLFFIPPQDMTARGILISALTTAQADERRSDRLESESITDPLTGLLNRRGLEREFNTRQKERARATKAGLGRTAFALTIVDLDKFKSVNDTHGHDVGDDVITSAANALVEGVRVGDIVARIGGEEMVIFSEVHRNNVSGYLSHMNELRAQSAVSIPDVSVAPHRVTMSAGSFVWDPSTVDLTFEQAFKLADNNLYEAKEGGRNQMIANGSGAFMNPAAEV